MASTYHVIPTSDPSSGCAYAFSSMIRLLGANQTCFSCMVKAYSFSTSQTSPSHSCHLWHYFILLHSWGKISFSRHLCPRQSSMSALTGVEGRPLSWLHHTLTAPQLHITWKESLLKLLQYHLLLPLVCLLPRHKLSLIFQYALRLFSTSPW